MSNKKDILRFIELTKLKGTIESSQALFESTEGSLTVLAAAPPKANVIGIKGSLVVDLPALGQLGIDNLGILYKLIGTFPGEEVSIKKTENKLNFATEDSKLKVSAVLQDPQYVTNTIESAKFEGALKVAKGEEFTLDKEDVKKLTTYAQTIATEEFVLQGKAGELSVVLDDSKNSIVSKFPIANVKPFKVKLGKFFLDVLSVVNNTVTLSVSDDKPVYLKVEEGNIVFEYVVAPKK